MSQSARRTVLLLPVLAALPAAAQHAGEAGEDLAAAERAILAGRRPVETGIAFDMPRLSENGNSVDVAVRVDSPMTAADHVRAIHILSERNPVPRVASFTLTPRAGRAEVATRIRLATSQQIIVLAETSAGQVHRAAREVIVVLGACVEGG
jgi:sulfur-oxidizing protein SoxY